MLRYAREHHIGVLVYGPLARGLLIGTMSTDTPLGDDDWRSGSPAFQGSAFSRNLAVVAQLKRFAAEELGCSVAQLAVTWTLANPAVNVAIVGRGTGSTSKRVSRLPG